MLNSTFLSSLLFTPLFALVIGACAPPEGDDERPSDASTSDSDAEGSSGGVRLCDTEPPEDADVFVLCDLAVSASGCPTVGNAALLTELVEERRWASGPAWSAELSVAAHGPATVWKTLEVRPHGAGGTILIHDRLADEEPYVGDFTVASLRPRLSYCEAFEAGAQQLSCVFWAAAIASEDRCGA